MSFQPVVRIHVALVVVTTTESLITHLTPESVVACVTLHVGVQVRLLLKTLITPLERTRDSNFLVHKVNVLAHCSLREKFQATKVTHAGWFAVLLLMPAHVSGTLEWGFATIRTSYFALRRLAGVFVSWRKHRDC